jgi:hypothetical protein
VDGRVREGCTFDDGRRMKRMENGYEEEMGVDVKEEQDGALMPLDLTW